MHTAIQHSRTNQVQLLSSAPERWVSAPTESLTFYLSQSTDFTIWLVFI